MNKPSLLILLLSLLTLAACSDNTIDPSAPAGSQADTPANAIGFSTYMSRNAHTRAGAYGAIDTDRLKQEDYGFGVFAYYTPQSTYQQWRTQNAVDGRYPDSMYNERIVYRAADDKWDYYDPRNTKYWPNEFADGPLDQQADPATGSVARGNVSFFAYAPYAPATHIDYTDPASSLPMVEAGDWQMGPATGITAFSRNDYNGTAATRYSDPYLRYVISDEAEHQVDLLWGTTGNNSENVVGSTQPGVSADTYDPQAPHPRATGTSYYVNADLTKQKTNGTVSFAFKHALAKIGGSYVQVGDNPDGSDDDPNTPTNGLMVILDIDKDGQETGGSLQPYAGTPTPQTKYNTKVTINQITLSSEKQLTPAGKAAIEAGTAIDYTNTDYVTDLYNTAIFNLATGVWTEHHTTGSTLRTQTILPPGYSDNSDNSDNSVTPTLHPALAEPATFNTAEYTQARYEELPIGVTTFAKNVYQDDTQPFVFIPGTHPIVTVSITYTVRTFDDKLANHYSEVKQRITKRLYFLDEIELNRQYNVLLHLGLTSMKFEATVSDWEAVNVTPTPGTVPTPTDGTSPVATYEDDLEHVYLPKNVAP